MTLPIQLGPTFDTFLTMADRLIGGAKAWRTSNVKSSNNHQLCAAGFGNAQRTNIHLPIYLHDIISHTNERPSFRQNTKNVLKNVWLSGYGRVNSARKRGKNGHIVGRQGRCNVATLASVAYFRNLGTYNKYGHCEEVITATITMRNTIVLLSQLLLLHGRANPCIHFSYRDSTFNIYRYYFARIDLNGFLPNVT